VFGGGVRDGQRLDRKLLRLYRLEARRSLVHTLAQLRLNPYLTRYKHLAQQFLFLLS
jgi:hypothetical protein